jgi:hypothetical protein
MNILAQILLVSLAYAVTLLAFLVTAQILTLRERNRRRADEQL